MLLLQVDTQLISNCYMIHPYMSFNSCMPWCDIHAPFMHADRRTYKRASMCETTQAYLLGCNNGIWEVPCKPSYFSGLKVARSFISLKDAPQKNIALRICNNEKWQVWNRVSKTQNSGKSPLNRQSPAQNSSESKISWTFHEPINRGKYA